MVGQGFRRRRTIFGARFGLEVMGAWAGGAQIYSTQEDPKLMYGGCPLHGTVRAVKITVVRDTPFSFHKHNSDYIRSLRQKKVSKCSLDVLVEVIGN